MKHTILILFLFIAAMSQNSSSQGFLRALGQQIVNNGGEVLLRGIGLGGWLLPEGYMLQTSSFANAPWEIRKKIEDLVGTANADQFFSAYRANFVRKEDVHQIAAWGFNSIRLPMHYGLLTPKDQPGVYTESGFAIIDSLLSWCESNHLYLILDLHAAPGGQSNGNICDYNPAELSLWESTQNQQRTVDLWKKIAQRYASREWIGGYDLLNEPAWNLGGGNVPLRTLYTQITQAIREADTNHIVFVEGNWYATDFTGLSPAWDANMAYSFHKYWNTNDPASISGYLNLRSTNNRPLWLGESGENSNAWFTDCIALMEANNIGWSWWTLKKVESGSGLMSVQKNAEYNYLLQYWSGKASKPSAAYAMVGLNGLATDLLGSRCKTNRDVLDAMLRQPRSTALVPFCPHDLPGTIFAADYDLGRYNIAYHDAEYQNTGGGASWNNGGMLRNDGVDIEECSDLPTNGYDVAWVATGEYLNYTVNVSKSASYKITARVSGGASGGKILLRWDGAQLVNIADVPYTGGWQNWQSIDLGTASLSAGSHTFGAYFYFGGFNINAFSITEVSASATDDAQPALTFSLDQNFPNPFNPTTQFAFTLRHAGLVTLKVFNVLGQEVAEPVHGLLTGGRHVLTFDASRLPTGVYVYQLRSGEDVLTKRLTLLK